MYTNVTSTVNIVHSLRACVLYEYIYTYRVVEWSAGV